MWDKSTEFIGNTLIMVVSTIVVLFIEHFIGEPLIQFAKKRSIPYFKKLRRTFWQKFIPIGIIISLTVAINVGIHMFLKEDSGARILSKPELHRDIDLPLLIIIATMGILSLVFYIIFIILLYQKRILSKHLEVLKSQLSKKNEINDPIR